MRASPISSTAARLHPLTRIMRSLGSSSGQDPKELQRKPDWQFTLACDAGMAQAKCSWPATADSQRTCERCWQREALPPAPVSLRGTMQRTPLPSDPAAAPGDAPRAASSARQPWPPPAPVDTAEASAAQPCSVRVLRRRAILHCVQGPPDTYQCTERLSGSTCLRNGVRGSAPWPSSLAALARPSCLLMLPTGTAASACGDAPNCVGTDCQSGSAVRRGVLSASGVAASPALLLCTVLPVSGASFSLANDGFCGEAAGAAAGAATLHASLAAPRLGSRRESASSALAPVYSTGDWHRLAVLPFLAAKAGATVSAACSCPGGDRAAGCLASPRLAAR